VFDIGLRSAQDVTDLHQLRDLEFQGVGGVPLWEIEAHYEKEEAINALKKSPRLDLKDV
jgi:hypothetical protein